MLRPLALVLRLYFFAISARTSDQFHRQKRMSERYQVVHQGALRAAQGRIAVYGERASIRGLATKDHESRVDLGYVSACSLLLFPDLG